MALLLWLGGCTDDVTGTSQSSTGATAGSSSSGAPDDTTGGGTTGVATQGGGGTADGTGTSTGSTSTGPDTDTSPDTDTDSTTGMPPECTEDAECDDMLACTGEETCVDGACVAGTPIVCDDGIACTLDECDEPSGGMCVAYAQNANCDNGIYCDGQEVCDPLMDCQPGTPVVCDDAVACTTDACDEAAGACAFLPDHASCQNGLVCDGDEVCDPALDCQPGMPPDCNDMIGCTADSCSEMAGGCVNDPVDVTCDNAVFCDGVETCDAVLGCQPGSPVMCADDGVVCTVETCDELLMGCETALDNGLCAPGSFCSSGGCVAGNPCVVDADCDDGIGCNGAETCDLSLGVPGVCTAGTPIDCDDGVGCTLDACLEPGVCANDPFNALCNNGDVCDGLETCDPVLDCQPGVSLSCDDGIACTVDGCDAITGCFNAPQNFLCADGSFCNGIELCDPVAGCGPGAPVVCPSDGVACTTEACDDALAGCIVTPHDDVCGCGETCIPALGGCSNACNVATCAGQVWECGNCIDDDLDCDVDSNDSECFGPCDNNEEGFAGEIPGQNAAPCKADCYFDNDSGSGNDDCYWSHKCDPLEPEIGCDYDPMANIPGTGLTCMDAQMMQSMTCDDVCGPLVPNGCDCFGCCEIDLPAGGSVTVYLGTEDAGGAGTCNSEVVENPMLCAPCTQVAACLNECTGCEICFGATELPPGCGQQECPDEVPPCGQPGQAPCAVGSFCLTGCCIAA